MTLARRFCCSTCGETFTGRAWPSHEHPLQRLCRYPNCSTLVAGINEACSEEHALLYCRVSRGLADTLQPSGERTGLALFARRRAQGLSRVAVARIVGVRWHTIWRAELEDHDVSRWDEKLRALWSSSQAKGDAPEPAVKLADPLYLQLRERLSDLQSLVAAYPVLQPTQRLQLLTQCFRPLPWSRET